MTLKYYIIGFGLLIIGALLMFSSSTPASLVGILLVVTAPDIAKKLTTKIKTHKQTIMYREQTEVNGLVVTTVHVYDDYFSTSILDQTGTHFVETYTDLPSAKSGHERWCESAKTAEVIEVFDHYGLLPSTIKLVRNPTVDEK